MALKQGIVGKTEKIKLKITEAVSHLRGHLASSLSSMLILRCPGLECTCGLGMRVVGRFLLTQQSMLCFPEM